MINEIEYKTLLKIADKKATYFNNIFHNYTLSEEGYIIKKEIEIQSADVIHDLILKYQNSNFEELKEKIGKQFIRIYFENRIALDPGIVFYSRKRYLNHRLLA